MPGVRARQTSHVGLDPEHDLKEDQGWLEVLCVCLIQGVVDKAEVSSRHLE